VPVQPARAGSQQYSEARGGVGTGLGDRVKTGKFWNEEGGPIILLQGEQSCGWCPKVAGRG
jgi:hypothetical protein